ncbi:MAG TPA: hypothetical protein VFI47_18505 [Acidimicrobiales bacterium]|nr:hypothetical protein [Acidimicrobiales bacterium]
MRSFWIVACAAGLIVGAACSAGAGSRADTSTSSDASKPSTTLTVQPPPATTAPPPAPLSTEQAAERYLAVVEPYNLALEAFEQAINGGQPVESLQTAAAAVASANETQVQELQATAWPADVQPAVDELVTESGQAQIYWLQASQAPTRDALIAAAVSASEHDGGAAAGTIRTLLGLDDYAEDDYS